MPTRSTLGLGSSMKCGFTSSYGKSHTANASANVLGTPHARPWARRKGIKSLSAALPPRLDQLRDGIDITAGARVTRVLPPVVTKMTGSPAARVSLPLACTMARRSPLRS